MSTKIQAILFKRNKFDSKKARKFLDKHNHKPIKRVHKTTNYLRYRLTKPKNKGMYRMINFGNDIKAVIEIVKPRRKTQKGGRVLGSGKDGCVIDPPIMCNSNMKSKNKVSKIMNIDYFLNDRGKQVKMTKKHIKSLRKEYDFGKIFRDIDPKSHYFLAGMDMCKKSFVIDKISEDLQDDLNRCKYDKNKTLNAFNIIMKKGIDFKRILRRLKQDDVLKSLVYLLEGMKLLIKNDILLLDIKGGNLLYSPDEVIDKKAYPVFIDFSDDMVMKNKKDFKKWLEYFSYNLGTYSTWGFELYSIFYKNYIKLPKKKKLFSKKPIFNQQYLDRFIKDVNRDTGKNLEKDYKEISDYVLKVIDSKAYPIIYEKIMIYSLGRSFISTYPYYKIENNKVLTDILFPMIDEDIRERPDINKLIKNIKKHISYKKREDLLIKN